MPKPEESSVLLSEGLGELLGHVSASEPPADGQDAEPAKTKAPEQASKPAPKEPEQVTPEPKKPVAEKPEPPKPLTDADLERILSDRRMQDRIYRQAQSMKDKELARERQQQQQEAEQRRLSEMDDEELGRTLRERQAQEAQVQPAVAQKLYGMLAAMQQQALGAISDEGVRSTIEQRASEFKTFPEFFGAVVKAEQEHQTAKAIARERTKLEKELRDSIRKELTAEMADQSAPELGRGIPTASVREVHGEQAISEGLSELMRRKR